LNIGTLATYPPRYDSAWFVIRSISDQLDQLRVYVNDQGVLPDWYRDTPSNVTVVLGRNERGDLVDTGKFYWSTRLPEETIHFVLDDDLSYPDDYVERTIDELQATGMSAVVGFHGWCFGEGGTVARLHHFHQSLSSRQPVHALKTGCMAYPCSLLRFPLSVFHTTHTADLWAALHAQQTGTPMVCLPHREAWIRPRRTNDEQADETPLEEDPTTTEIAKYSIIDDTTWAIHDLQS